MLEALEQRRAKYIEAINQAKANGDDRKARMHERISKVIVEPRRRVYIYTAFIYSGLQRFGVKNERKGSTRRFALLGVM